MSKTNFLLILVVITISSVKSQEYLTYKAKSMPDHTLRISNDTLSVKIHKGGLFPSLKFDFLAMKKNDTIYIDKIINDDENSNGTGVSVSDSSNAILIKQFEKSKFLIKSDNELLLTGSDRPYFKKQLVDSIFSNNMIFFINDKLFKAPEDSELIKEKLNKELRKPKKAVTKILDGKKAYEKYGFIGLNGVIEFSDKKRRCEK